MLPVRDSQMDKVPAREANLYYYGSDNTRRSKIDTYQSTNYTFDISSKDSQSVGTVILTPNSGLSHVWVGLKLPRANYTGLAFPTGWGFSLVQSMTYRYGSSPPFSLSGNALRICASVNAGNYGEKEQLMMAFGGQAFAGADFTSGDDSKLYAYFPLTLASVSSESGTEVRAPFPTDMLNGPITIDIQWANFTNVFPAVAGAQPVPVKLADAWIGTRQIIPLYQDDKMVIKQGQVYNYPIKFYQPPNAINLSNGVNKNVEQQTVNLVGVKSGQCQGILSWVVKSGGADSLEAMANATTFIGLKDTRMTYAGTVLQYKRGNKGADAFMDTLFEDSPTYFSSSKFSIVSGAWEQTTNATISYFQNFPFVQKYEALSDACMLQNGVRVDSGSIQLDLVIDDDYYDPTANYTLYYMPYFQAALSLDAGGGCNYLF
jgi:hypothetical protein